MSIHSVFIIIGIALFGYSLTMDPYTDVDLFNETYMSMTHEHSVQFYALRDEMLTPKYRIQDIGITSILFSLSVMALFKIGAGRIISPSKKSYLIILAFVLPLITIAGFVFDLFQGMYRTEFPYWADSLGIPLMGVPVLFLMLLIWSLVHLALIKNVTSQHLSTAISLRLNPWLILISSITVLLILLCTYEGLYWLAFPGLIWLYFYLSIGVSRLNLKSS